MTIHSLKNKLVPILGTIGMIIMLVIIVAADKRPLCDICDTDYVNTLYPAGHMVNHGAGREIYPDLKAKSFYTEKFAAYTRNLLNKPNPRWLYMFAYAPAVALSMTPLALLDVRSSLVAWQLLSMLAIAISAAAFALMPGTRASVLRVFLCVGLYLPVLDVVTIGQTSILLGFFPFCLGYLFWQNERYLATGLCWSILGLKPQMAVPVAIICGALLLASIQKKIDKREVLLIIAGGVLGTFILHLIPILVLGPDIFPLWLNALKVTGEVFAAENTGYWQYHLFCSVPCLVILMLPKELWSKAKLPSYFFGLFAMLASVPICARILAMQLSAGLRRDLLIVIATPFLMICAPHLLLYDTCLMLLPAWILFYRLPQQSEFARFGRPAMVLLMVAMNIYLLAILTQPSLPSLGWQVFLLCGLILFILIALLKLQTVREATT